MRPLDGCTAAAEELSSLGIDRAHADPKPLRSASIHKRSIAGLAYERMVFEHDPALPATLEADGLGGPARAVVHLCRHPGGPQAVAGVGARCRSGRHGRPAVVPDRTHPSQAGVQRRDAGAARPRLSATPMAGLPRHGSAGQCGGHDARGIRGARGRALGAAPSHRRCRGGDFDGKPGRGAGLPPGEAD